MIAVCSEFHTKHLKTPYRLNVEIFGAFALTLKEAITYVMSVRLSEGNSAAPIGRQILFYRFLSKYFLKHQILLKSDTKYRAV
jgi:hypothetical protein